MCDFVLHLIFNLPDSNRGFVLFRCNDFGCCTFLFKGENVMADYKTMYYKLFNSLSDAIEILQKAQQEGEDIYIISPDDEDEYEEDAES